MEKIRWTNDQEKIIRMRGANILVSAAAGSGKTAVLIERIFNRITDPAAPVDIDQFVVVTFTRAAAAQMKDRLRERLEEALSADSENRRLRRQISLLPSAHISTVHSFCLYIIQNYFDRIGFDPASRQGSDSELALLKKDTMEVMLEEEYEEAKEDFLELADMHLFNRSDEDMEHLILTIYEKAMRRRRSGRTPICGSS